MATLTTPSKTPSSTTKRPQRSKTDSSNSRFEAYNRLQAAAVAFGEKLPIPEIVAVGGQSDGKSSLLEALLGFRFNVREVEMGTRRPLILQMVHDASALEPRCRFQEEDSEEYGSPVVSASAIADIIKSRTEALLMKMKTAVSAKPIVMRAEYAHCPNLTIIDTPGFVLKAKKGEPDNTPDEILSMVKSLASPQHRILLFLQQSSVEWCSSLWLDSIREIDPSFRRTIIVVSKFDNRLKEFTDRWEVDRYLSASGYLGENTRPYFVALPKDRATTSNEEFRRQILKVDAEVLRQLREGIKGGFDEEKFKDYIGFSCLRDYLESELQRRYKDAAPATLALLEQRCNEVSNELNRIDSKIQATSDVTQLRRSAMLYAAAISNHLGILIDGAADPAPEQWGKTTVEEQVQSGVGIWPGVTVDIQIQPANASLRLYGGAAFERVMHEFRCAAYSIECPPLSREKVANILLAHAGRGRGRGLTEAAAELAKAAARSWLAPLLDTVCDRLAFVLMNVYDIALERSRDHGSNYGCGKIDAYIGFQAALRHAYHRFIKEISKECKQLIQHHLHSATSAYSEVYYENVFEVAFGTSVTSSARMNQNSAGSVFLELSDNKAPPSDEAMVDQENIPPEKKKLHITPGKGSDGKEALRESQMTVPETPSPDQPSDPTANGSKKELGNYIEAGPRKRSSRMGGNNRHSEQLRIQNGGLLFGNGDAALRSGSAYSEICFSAAQHFARIRQVLVERSVTSALNAGFFTPCRERLMVALGLDLFAVGDEKFMEMFVAPGAIDVLQNERQSLQKRQKMLQSCLAEFKTVARTL